MKYKLQEIGNALGWLVVGVVGLLAIIVVVPIAHIFFPIKKTSQNAKYFR